MHVEKRENYVGTKTRLDFHLVSLIKWWRFWSQEHAKIYDWHHRKQVISMDVLF